MGSLVGKCFGPAARGIPAAGGTAPLMSPAPGFARCSSFTSLRSAPHHRDLADMAVSCGAVVPMALLAWVLL